MILYKTIKEAACCEQIIEKSRFITHVKPVETKEVADNFIKEIKSKYKDATHNVPAMVIGDNFQIQWASDDGEPQGTSGAPIVQMIVKKGITNVVVVVTRYFGGIKLGTGGLVRAYTGSAKLGIEKAGIREVKEVCQMEYEVDYTYLAKIQSMEKDKDFTTENIEYGEKVIIRIVTDMEKSDQVKVLFSNLCGGREKKLLEVKKNT